MLEQLISLKNLVFIAGVLHFCQIPAMILSPRMLHWSEDLSKLSPINRYIVFVMGGGIILTVVGLGVVVALNPGEIVGGGRLGPALACFLGLFWLYRASIQIFLYSRIWPKGWLGYCSHHGLAALFTFQSGVYCLAFLFSILSP